ncbi:MAG: ribonuclease HIII [bacterium]
MKAKTYVYVPTENVRKKMIEYYQDKKREKNPPYSLFQASDNDTTVTLYEKGKIMFQGPNADMDFDMWAAVEKKNNKRDIYKDIDSKEKKNTEKKEKKVKDDFDYAYLKKVSTIGSDEVGTGDYLGPIIVTAAYVPKDKISHLMELGVGDSKKISDDKIRELGPILGKEIVYAASIVTNADYNKIKEVNINKVKAILHNKVLYKLANTPDLKYEKIVIDQFVNEKKYYEYLQGYKNVQSNIVFLTKAEDKVYSVAVASIISRYIFLVEMDKISAKLGSKVPLGSGKKVLEFSKKLVEKKGIEILDIYAKKNFKTTNEILDTNV